jgi:hypothetical protein
MKEFFPAPTSFFDLACLRHAVRLAWRAAASEAGASGGGVEGAAAVAGTALGEAVFATTSPDGPAAASPNGLTQTLRAIAGRERRIWNSTKGEATYIAGAIDALRGPQAWRRGTHVDGQEYPATPTLPMKPG